MTQGEFYILAFPISLKAGIPTLQLLGQTRPSWFKYIKFYEDADTPSRLPIFYCGSGATTAESTKLVTTETPWPEKLEIFTIWPFAEKAACSFLSQIPLHDF